MEAFKCVGDRCSRPACCRHNGDKALCYIHAACERQSDLQFFDMNSAKRQAIDLKRIASQVWEDLVEELNDAESKQSKKTLTKTLAVKAPVSSSSVIPSSSSRHPAVPKSNIWESAKQLPETKATNGNKKIDSDPLSQASDASCPKCHVKGYATYRVVSAAIDAAKADTWGSSGRPDRVLQFTCGACNGTWFLEEG